ncbi:hypothetical protein LCGC14_0704080 [marine sediment metagenome]|uniref:Uncharacterized protein n=1 Tax=marine sediment metagenome TaxID=412755 RepID=A0A0F9T2Y2_9ZZZZ
MGILEEMFGAQLQARQQQAFPPLLPGLDLGLDLLGGLGGASPGIAPISPMDVIKPPLACEKTGKARWARYKSTMFLQSLREEIDEWLKL